MNNLECVYPDSEGGGEVGQHIFAKHDCCSVCGMKSPAPIPGRTNSGYQSGSLEFNPIELNAQGFRAEIQPNGDVWITDRVKQYKPEGGPEVVSVRDGDTIIIPKDKCKELSSLLCQVPTN